MSTVNANFWSAQTLDNRWWLFWLCHWTVLLFSIQAYAMMLSLSENTNLHSSSQNSLDAWLNMGGGPSETSSFHPLNNIWEHQQDKREMEGERRRGQETNMKMRQQELVKASNATVDEPPLCVQEGERTVEWNTDGRGTVKEISESQHLSCLQLATIVTFPPHPLIQEAAMHSNDSGITSPPHFQWYAFHRDCSQGSSRRSPGRLEWTE